MNQKMKQNDDYKPLMGDDYKPIADMEVTQPPSQITASTSPVPQTYKQFKELVFKYFEGQEYECNLAFNEGYSKTTGEDNKSVDFIVNLNSLIYNYASRKNKSLSLHDKNTFHDLFEGIQLLTKSMKQYDDQTTEKIFIAHILGYVLKLMRNFYHA